jgi:hypothetical protein
MKMVKPEKTKTYALIKISTVATGLLSTTVTLASNFERNAFNSSFPLSNFSPRYWLKDVLISSQRTSIFALLQALPLPENYFVARGWCIASFA